jgi:hypothetical protein
MKRPDYLISKINAPKSLSTNSTSKLPLQIIRLKLFEADKVIKGKINYRHN